ncbi:Glycosyltransferases involved in cell wall biogenesis [Fragilaria crotonensis]|nr:Glycosyltransferases involved in cell wall biogenesis [Fragilaria crotonensis]
MLLKYDLRFPEGDYFYEDNAFHWRTLTHAARCSKTDRVLFHHRRARKGQTSFNFNQPDGEAVVMSMEWFRRYTSVAKIGGYYPNQYAIGRGLFPETSAVEVQGIECLPPVAPKEVAITYFEWLKASAWIGQKQITHQMRDKFYRRLEQVRQHWAGQDDIIVPEGYWLSANEPVTLNWATRPKNIDLSIILPTVNVAEFIYNVLDEMYEKLFKPDFTFEVFAIDDGSTDNTAEILRDFADDHKHNFYFLSTSASNGAGKARNLALPLVEGRYVYCVDSDDSYDFDALADAVVYATKYKKDVMVMPYFVEFVGPDKKTRREGMMKSDERIWTAVRAQPDQTHSSLKQAALGLINYPWKQLTSSKLCSMQTFSSDLQRFTTMSNSTGLQLLHQRISLYNKEVCSHRKFDISSRSTHGSEKCGTNECVRFSGDDTTSVSEERCFDGQDGELVIFPMAEFCVSLLKWAKSRVPPESRSAFQDKQTHLLSFLKQTPPNQANSVDGRTGENDSLNNQ